MSEPARKPMTRPEMEAEARRLIAEMVERAKAGDLCPLVSAVIQQGLAARLGNMRKVRVR